jgi:chromosome partitioning protein
VIVVDTPPALSFSTSTAIAAADGLVIPAPAAMMDFESARYFLKLTKEVLGAVRHSYGLIKEFDFLRVLITKFEPGKAVQQKLANWQRSIFDEYCLGEPMVLSNAVQNLGPTMQTLYEAGTEFKGSRESLKRALEAANAVNALVEEDVIKIFKNQAREPANLGAASEGSTPQASRAAERAA